jgi:hypothetical protein
VPHPGHIRARRAAWIGLWGGVLFAPAMAHAQEAPLLPEEQPQIDKRYTAVMERVQPGYVAPGIPVGAFTLSPALSVSTGYDDNIFATQQDRVADGYVRIKPQATLQSQWAGDSLTFDAQGTIDRYVHRTTEDVADYAVTASGLFEISHDTTLRLAARAESDHQSRLSQDIFALTIRPVAYREQSAAMALTHDFNRLRVTADARIARFDWSNGRQLDGTVLDQQTSNNISYRVGVRASFEQSPSLAWFVSASANDRNFSTGTVQTPERDSHGYQLLAGVDFEPVQLMRGSIGIGYIAQDYRLPFYTNLSGVDFDARVQFFPSQLTTITVQGDRSVLDSGIPGSGGYLSTEGTIRVDHELLRQLILSGSVGYQNNRFNNLDRVDDRIATSASATYKMNRTASIELHYDRLDQSSHGADRYRAYVDNRLLAGVTLRR